MSARTGSHRSCEDPSSGGWTSVRGFRSWWRTSRDGWNQLPASARASWWATLAVGLWGSVFLWGAVTLLVRWAERAGVLAWERPFLRWLEANASVPVDAARWLSIWGNAFLLWPVLAAVGVLLLRARRHVAALACVLGLLLVEVPIFACWHLWDRARPNLWQHPQLQGLFNSFPSGHVAHASFAFGLAAFFWWRRSRSSAERFVIACLWLLLLAVVAFGRLQMGSHWPTDVLAGALVGAAWLTVVVVALTRLERASFRI